MPAPRRPRQPSSRPAPPLPSLGLLIQDHEQWLRSLPAKPGRGALRDWWQKKDAQQGQRPDYLLWREMHDVGAPLPKKQDIADLASRALRSPEASVQWAAMAMLPEVLESPALPSGKKELILSHLRQRLISDRNPLRAPAASPTAFTLLLWMGRSFLEPDQPGLWASLQELLQKALPEWKLGRKLELTLWDEWTEAPVSKAQITRRLAQRLHRLVSLQVQNTPARAAELAPWHLTAWMLLRDARPPQSAAKGIEIEVLLDAAATARLGGDGIQASRLTVLALHLLPERLPAPVEQRCRVAAWSLMEVGLIVPEMLRTSLDELPFPGDLSTSENGIAAARQYLDVSDPCHLPLMSEVQTDPAWEILRRAGVVLNHPLAALSWIARKAQSHALKKQQDLLQAAATLAERHQRLTTLGRLLPYLPSSADLVMRYAKILREQQRRMPFLRDEVIWQDWTRNLKAAWTRLEPEVLQDPELIFVLHETLLDREVTLLRCLPADLRQPPLRHLHSRNQPSPFIQTLAADLRQMQHLEHQRQVELWSVATELRGRSDLAGQVWVSLVLRGESGQGRYSLIVQGPHGKVLHQDRVRAKASSASELDWAPVIQKLVQAVGETCVEPVLVLAAIDGQLADIPWQNLIREAGLSLPVSFVPSWEWAFRVLRETPASPVAESEILWANTPVSTSSSPVLPLPVDSCILLPQDGVANAETRWHQQPKEGATPRPPLRSLALGNYGQIASSMPMQRGSLKQDLIRLCLAQNTRRFIAPPKTLNPEEAARFQAAPFSLAEGICAFGIP